MTNRKAAVISIIMAMCSPQETILDALEAVENEIRELQPAVQQVSECEYGND